MNLFLTLCVGLLDIIRVNNTRRDYSPCDSLIVCGIDNLNFESEGELVPDILEGLITDLIERGQRLQFRLFPSQERINTPFAFPFFRTEHKLFPAILKSSLPLWKRVFSRSGLREFRDDVMANFYSSLLAETKPTRVIGIGLPTALMRASQKIGVPCFEVQHGILDSQTIEMYWPRDSKQELIRPDAVLVWDKFFQFNLMRAGIHSEVLGYPFVNREVKDAARSHFYSESGKLLVLAQYGFHPSGEDRWGILPPSTLDSILIFAKQHRYVEILLRLHPVTNARMSHEIRRKLTSKFTNLVVQEAREAPITAVLRSARLQVSGPSAGVYFSAVMGIKNFVIGKFDVSALPKKYFRTGMISQISELTPELLASGWHSSPELVQHRSNSFVLRQQLARLLT